MFKTNPQNIWITVYLSFSNTLKYKEVELLSNKLKLCSISISAELVKKIQNPPYTIKSIRYNSSFWTCFLEHFQLF